MNPLSLTFHHEFDNVSQLDDTGKESRIRFCADLPWTIRVRSKCSDRTSNTEYLGMYIRCNTEDTGTLWSCEHESTITLINRLDDGRSIVRPVRNAFNAKYYGFGCSTTISWDKLLKPDEGFIENDKIIVAASITVKNTIGVPRGLQFDFTVSGFGADNVALLIEGKKVYVAKQYLALHSDVFKSMFYGEFSEKNKEEIELPGVSHEEFVEFLYVIYPSYRMITYDSYEFILTLADKYQVEYALNAVESYLIKTKKLITIEKLVLGDRFRRHSLIKHCIKTFKSLEEIKESESQLSSLSESTQAAIMRRMLQLV